MADYSINAVPRRVVYSGSAGVGPYAFTFEVLAQTDIAVYKNITKLTLTTDYTVTINANGTGSVTLVTEATSSDSVIITGARAIQRTTDFATAGDLVAASLNEQFDANVIFAQQVAETAKRAITAPVYDPEHVDSGGALNMTLPRASLRASRLLGFDSTGNPTTYDIDGTALPSNASGINYLPAGANAVGRTVEAKLRESISIKDFGAVGDGVTDDTIAVQAWLAYGMSSKKPLLLDCRVKITSDFSLSGSASTLVVRGAGDAAFVASGASRITIAGTFNLLEFSGVEFTGFSYCALWLGDNSTTKVLRLWGCKNFNSKLFLGCQGDPTAANYTTTRWYIPNKDITVEFFDMQGCEIGTCTSGVVLPCVVERAVVDKNWVHDLSNSDTAGSELDRGVKAIQIGPLGGTVGKDFGPSGTDYSSDYERIKHLSVTNNTIERLTQTVVTKGSNGIAINGFNCVVSGNMLRDIKNTGGVDTGDGNNNDNEAIYIKGADTIVTNNTMRNCGSTEALIAIKNYSRAVTDFSTKVDATGRNNLVSGNVAYWDITPADGIGFASIHGGPATIVHNRGVGLTGSAAIVIHGVLAPDTGNEYPIIVDDNYFEGTHATMIVVRGGVDALTVGSGNVNKITGGSGNCAYLDISQSRGQLYKNIKIAGAHVVRNRTGATSYNAIVRAGSTLYPISGLTVEGMVCDHYDSSNTSSVYKGLHLHTATEKVRGLMWRNNTYPEGLYGNQVFDIALGDVEFVFDDTITAYTTDNTETVFFLARCGENSVVSVDLDATGYSKDADEGAYYRKSAVYKRTTGNLSIIGAAATLAEIETDAGWNSRTTVSSYFVYVNCTGDATYSTKWSIRVRAKVLMAT